MSYDSLYFHIYLSICIISDCLFTSSPSLHLNSNIFFLSLSLVVLKAQIPLHLNSFYSQYVFFHPNINFIYGAAYVSWRWKHHYPRKLSYISKRTKILILDVVIISDIIIKLEFPDTALDYASSVRTQQQLLGYHKRTAVWEREYRNKYCTLTSLRRFAQRG